jgi:putative transposase
MIDSKDHRLSVRSQCRLLDLNRSNLYYKPVPHLGDTELINQILEIHERVPQYGYRRIHAQLNLDGTEVNRKRVQRLMRLLEIQALYPKPKTTMRGNAHKVYPYLLGGLSVDQPHQVWQVDITYLKLPQGFVYLTALIDIYSRFVVSWRLSISLSQESCLEAFEDALWSHGAPDIVNSDQGVQFTSESWEKMCLDNAIAISMSHKGGSTDNAYIERFWRTLKYEGFYLDIPESVPELKHKVGEFIKWYNEERLHSSLGYDTPSNVLKTAKTQACAFMDNSTEFPTIPQAQQQPCVII